MKLIDFSIIFFAIFSVIFTICDLKNDMLYNNKMNTIMLNDAIDEIVIDSLNISFSVENEKININKEVLMECYTSELSLLCKGTNIMKEYYESNSICILTEEDGFYLWNKGEWTDKILYTSKGNKEFLNEERVSTIKKEIEERYGIILLLASNAGETFKNSISEYSFVSVYFKNYINIFDKEYKMMFVSGACIKVSDLSN